MSRKTAEGSAGGRGLLNVVTVAERLDSSAASVRSKIARGLLPFTRVGRRVFVPEAELEKFLSLLPSVDAATAIANQLRRKGTR